jgi:outer membrane receptor for ferrienterochelin and colicins
LLVKTPRKPSVLRTTARAQGALLVVAALFAFGPFGNSLPAVEISASVTNSPNTSASDDDLLRELQNIRVPYVQGASKYWQKISEAPSSVTILTSDDVKKYGHRTLADMLRTVPGLYVTYDRNYSFLGVRGFNLGDFNNRVLLLVDGHRINNSLADSAPIGTEFPLDVDLIDRVEIIRGPGSSIYGNNAFFGVINVITRKGRDFFGKGVGVSLETGSFDTYKGRLTFGHKFENGIETVLSGSIYDSEGQDRLFFKEFNTPTSNNGIAENGDADKYKSVFASISYGDFNLQGSFVRREKSNPTAPFFTDFNDPRMGTDDARGYVSLNYAREFAEVGELTARVYYDRSDLTIGEPYGGTLFEDEQTAEWWGSELQLTKHFGKHAVTIGGEYRDDFRQEQRILDADSGLVFKNVHRERQSHGVYLQGDFVLVPAPDSQSQLEGNETTSKRSTDTLRFSGGVRYDQYSDFDPTYNPRLALIYNPIGQSVFKAIYGTAFRAPNFFELSDPRFQDINPEGITTYELVYEQGLGEHFRTSVAGFYNEIDDLIFFNSAAGHQRFENLSGAKAQGVELALDAAWPGLFQGRASYSYQKTEDSATGKVLVDSPLHLAKLNVNAPIMKDKLFAGLEVQYLSKRRTVFLTPLGTQAEGSPARGYGVVNFTLFSKNIVKGLEISATIYDLFDETYGDPSTPFHSEDIIYQDGRSFRLKLTYRF